MWLAQTVVQANKAVAAKNFMGFTQTPTSLKVRSSFKEMTKVNPQASHIKAPYRSNNQEAMERLDSSKTSQLGKELNKWGGINKRHVDDVNKLEEIMGSIMGSMTQKLPH